MQPPGNLTAYFERFLSSVAPLEQKSVGVYFDDPDGNSNEVYFEDVEAFRQSTDPGEYHRKLEGIGF